VHDMGRTLHLLPAGNPSLTFLTRSRSHVVVKGESVCTGCLLHYLRTLAVVLSHDLVLIEKIEVAIAERPREPFESISFDRTAFFRLQATGVVDGHLSLFKGHSFATAIAAVGVAPGEHLTVSIKRRSHGGVQVIERT
ncbi:MAG: hypothetical protein O7B81_13370, partial [Gammaproteobacteria bacterium]|nr:hypothetical protein [Gammaproteobacteria bacterium]